MRVIWTPRAQQRLQEFYDYIARDQPANASGFIEKILARGNQIGDQPRAGRVVPEYQRETIREIFEGNYRIFYRIRSLSVDVLSVRHGAQRLPSQRHL